MRGQITNDENNGGSTAARIALVTLFGGIVFYGLWYWDYQTTYHRRPAHIMSAKHKLRDAVSKRYSILENEVEEMLGELRSEHRIPNIDEYGTDRREWKKVEAVRLKALLPALSKMESTALKLVAEGRTPIIPEGQDVGVAFTPYTRTREPYNVAVPQYMLGTRG